MTISLTKLKTLQKSDNLSQWQQNQKADNSNSGFFIKQKSYDPWELRRQEEMVITKQIPSLEKIKAKSCVSNHRYNKDINNHLENQRMLKARQAFYKSTNLK